jgi:hypothetical protein
MIRTSTKARVQKPADRALLAFILKNDPGAKTCYKHLLRMGAINIRSDYMLFRLPSDRYERAADPGAWHAFVPFKHTPNDGLHVCMIRHKDNSWEVHS